MGSNTMRMEVYDEEDGKIRHIVSAKEVVGMIGYTEAGVFQEEGILRLVEGLGNFRVTAQAIGVGHFSCFATAGMRALKNADDVAARVLRETGVRVDVISGEEEARLDFAGAYIPQGVAEGLVVDMGGGSTEIVRFAGAHIENCVSLPYGSLSLYKRFVKGILPSKGELKKIRSFADRQLECLDWLENVGGHLCLIGGTGRAVVRLHRDIHARAGEPMNGYTFGAEEIGQIIDSVMAHPKAGARRVLRVDPDRVHTILPGMTAIACLVRRAGVRTVSLSRSGVREGYIKTHLGQTDTPDN